jgi:hypothetical protein
VLVKNADATYLHTHVTTTATDVLIH